MKEFNVSNDSRYDPSGVERLLASRFMPEPSEGFRQRVLDAARMAGTGEVRRADHGNRWFAAAAVAAVILIWINMALASARHSDLMGRSSPCPAGSMPALAAAGESNENAAVIRALVRCGLAHAPATTSH